MINWLKIKYRSKYETNNNLQLSFVQFWSLEEKICWLQIPELGSTKGKDEAYGRKVGNNRAMSYLLRDLPSYNTLAHVSIDADEAVGYSLIHSFIHGGCDGSNGSDPSNDCSISTSLRALWYCRTVHTHSFVYSFNCFYFLAGMVQIGNVAAARRLNTWNSLRYYCISRLMRSRRKLMWLKNVQ